MLDSESQNPTDVQMYALKETNALVEEFMLLANITVGKKILRWVHDATTLKLLLTMLTIDGLVFVPNFVVGVAISS